MKKLCKAISAALIVLLLAAVIVLVAPRIFGIKMFSVLSGSMEPAYSTGDLIYVVPEDASKIKEGDVITFVLNNDGTVATHRVVEVDKDNEQFYTKGDANDLSDGRPVQYENVLGVVRFAIPKAGYLIGYMTTLPGKIITITIIMAIIILILLLQTQINKEEEEFLDDDEDEEEVWRPHPAFAKADRRSQRTGRKKEEPQKECVEEFIHTQKHEPAREAKRRAAPRRAVPSRRNEEAQPGTLPRRSQTTQQDVLPRRSAVIRSETAGSQPKKAESVVSVLPALDHVTEADYKYQRLQVCYKMITLMETMWNDTMDTMDEASEEVQESGPDIFDIYEDIDVSEKGGDDADEKKASGYSVS